MTPDRLFLESTKGIVELGKLLGKGGEGSVYLVKGVHNFVVKLYHPKVKLDQEKLEAVVRACKPELLSISAWPTDIVRSKNTKEVAGLFLPIVKDHLDIHELYSPKARVSNFPKAKWSFLYHVAANIARAFASVHSEGHVIGDVNHSNVLVAKNGTVKLIDCDSFQIKSGSQTFRCEVGVSTHTAPELQGQDLRKITRTFDHDNFGLAVLIFQLLFLGRHPFAGVRVGKDKPLEESIKHCDFAYDPSNSRVIGPPPNTVLLSDLPSQVSGLFRRAFSQSAMKYNSRPSAHEWVSALEGCTKQLRVCGTNPSHVYFDKSCSWCRLLTQTGRDFFPPSTKHVQTRAAIGSQQGYSLESVWREINSLSAYTWKKPLEPNPTKSTRGQQLVGALKKYSEKISALQNSYSSHKSDSDVGCQIGCVSILLAVVFANSVPGDYQAGFLIASIVLIVIVYFASIPANSSSPPELLQLIKDAQDYLNTVEEKKAILEREIGGKLKMLQTLSEGPMSFNKVKADLQNCYHSVKKIDSSRQERLSRVTASLTENYIRNNLDNYSLVVGVVDGIGPALLANLQSFGIETAADIEDLKRTKVPGIGPVKKRALFEWRNNVKLILQRRAPKKLSSAEISMIDQQIAQEKGSLQKKLSSGKKLLLDANRALKKAAEELTPQIEKDYMRLSRFKGDLNDLGFVRALKV